MRPNENSSPLISTYCPLHAPSFCYYCICSASPSRLFICCYLLLCLFYSCSRYIACSAVCLFGFFAVSCFFSVLFIVHGCSAFVIVPVVYCCYLALSVFLHVYATLLLLYYLMLLSVSHLPTAVFYNACFFFMQYFLCEALVFCKAAIVNKNLF